MPITPGTRLGAYEVVALIGAGGMGEVYRAVDTRLDRQVALKVLPAHLASDADFVLRFEREGRAIASLNHPHICTLFDIGRQGDLTYLVLELLEGENLAAVLERGPLPVDRALRTAIQIADALDRAHRIGIVHRDLKPGNIMVTADGVKLLDFGLARVDAPVVMADASIQLTRDRAPLTAAGTILGTIQYMSPEQLEAQPTDARTDVFAFGAVLYEMLTGRPAFTGQSHASLISAILKDEPPVLATGQPLPPALDHVVRRCLAKRADDRWQSIRDARLELEWIANGGAAVVSAAAPPPRAHRRTLVWAGAALTVAVLAAAGWWRTQAAMPVTLPVARYDLALPAEYSWLTAGVASPDGRWIVLGPAGPGGAISGLVLWSVEQGTFRVLPGSSGAYTPFWSPDSARLGFNIGRRLAVMDLDATAPEVICECPFNAATWLDPDIILYSMPPGVPSQRRSAQAGLYRVSLRTRQSAAATELDESRGETAHTSPQALPDGRHFLYLAQTESGVRSVFVGSIDSPARRPLEIESNVTYADPGYLAFGRNRSLVGQAFDLGRFALTGSAITLAPVIGRTVDQATPYRLSSSRNGLLVFHRGNAGLSSLAWISRTGARIGQLGETDDYTNPAISPDGTRVAVGVRTESGTRDLWVFDLQRGSRSRVTSDASDDFNPLWGPDGQTIFFSSDRSGKRALYRVDPNLQGATPVLVAEDAVTLNLESMTPDGQSLLSNVNSFGIWITTIAESKSQVLIDGGSFRVNEASLSPDGKWLAYSTNDSGRSEVYVTTFPKPGRRTLISTNGGLQPQWRGDSQELFYIEGNDQIMAVSIRAGTDFVNASAPTLLFRQRLASFTGRNRFVPSPDGSRFLVNVADLEQQEQGFTVIANWPTLLKP